MRIQNIPTTFLFMCQVINQYHTTINQNQYWPKKKPNNNFHSPSSNYDTELALFCGNNEYNPLFTPHISLRSGNNEISNFKLKTSLMFNADGLRHYDFFWFGQFTVSVLGTQYNATVGANATLSCENLTICNKTDYCIDDIQN